VAADAAIAMGYVAQYGLGLSVEQIRGTTLVIAVLIAASVAIDFVGRILGKHK
jgi:ABC-type Fe3+-siderophore transport system permease subunit